MLSRLSLESLFAAGKQGVRRLAAGGLDLLLPPSCLVCESPLDEVNQSSHSGFCRACLADLPLFREPGCPRCASPLIEVTGGKKLACTHCQDVKWRFDAAATAGEYAGELRRLVLAAKRAENEAIASGLGRLAADNASELLAGERPDVLTVVPMHWRRRLVRQTNSPEIIGSVVARRLGVPFAPRLLARRRSTAPQISLARSKRTPNVRRAFAVRRGYGLDGATVVLVDDVLTTGATASEAAATLKRAGARRVVLVVAAKSL
ncbi:MAG: double zinc ribbon domain-containing protein [Planctomycetota bacterium]